MSNASESRLKIPKNRALLDTNVVIRVIAGEPLTSARIDAFTDVFTAVISIGELFYGVFRSTRRAENMARLEKYLSIAVVLPCTEETARQYGVIKAAMTAKGKPIPENDLWIAACASEHDLTLLTRDAHFREIEGIRLEILD